MQPQHIKPKPQEQPEIKTCKFYVARKRRFCKFPAIKGSEYCHAHCSDLEGKVECPYEKGMYIDADKLEKHLQNCPKLKNKQQTMQSPWFEKGVNLEPPAQKIETINYLSTVSDQTISSVIRKVVELYLERFGEQAEAFFMSTEEQKIDNKTNDHIQAYLLAEVAHDAHLISQEYIYVQFGAGKGILSYALGEKVKEVFKADSKNVLLQREVRRNKFDRFFKHNPFFQRYKSDVSDFDFNKLPTIMSQTAHEKKQSIVAEQVAAELNECRMVGVCKHMCGAALDISVRGLMKTKMSGCVLASCCHHLCSYDTYLNNQYFEAEGWTGQDIQIMFKMSSWGTRKTWVEPGINLQELKQKSHRAMTLQQKAVIGRMCKRLTDLGRSKVLNANIVRYCSDQVTPENFVILTKS